MPRNTRLATTITGIIQTYFARKIESQSKPMIGFVYPVMLNAASVVVPTVFIRRCKVASGWCVDVTGL